MGQIKNDFEQWMYNERTEQSRFMNVQELGTLIEDFLMWKAIDIRNTESEQINSHHNRPPKIIIDSRLTDDEIMPLWVYFKSI